MFCKTNVRSTNVPFDQCSIRPMFHSTNVPFNECFVRRMFHSTNVPFDQCSFNESTPTLRSLPDPDLVSRISWPETRPRFRIFPYLYNAGSYPRYTVSKFFWSHTPSLCLSEINKKLNTFQSNVYLFWFIAFFLGRGMGRGDLNVADIYYFYVYIIYTSVAEIYINTHACMHQAKFTHKISILNS